MSTAIALRDMGPHAQPSGSVRHRPVSKQDINTTSPEDTDAWVNKPHDTISSTLPLDSHAFTPTHTYWITPHGLLTKNITILDLTPDMDVAYNGMTDAYKAQVKKTLKDHTFTPTWTCHRLNWLGLKYNITDDQGRSIAAWNHPWTSVGEARLTFPESSGHSAHPITLRNKRWGLRTEGFTVNSQPFVWEMDSLWHSTNMTLYKVFRSEDGERKVEVGRYAQKWWGGFVTGGIAVVDGRELDGFLACLTLCVVLKKKRQRAAERNNGAE
ncbi:hypothetical protein CC80DRAFT_211289 [Byssothecium circinans]|uniref:Phospholipid scramblase n=1 Tax=Byssothecium circinans TaxID=147558 RepID=A0A6A5TK19_9PLEO|nr:hypothetical protein CC80DRAFT_211289 [Byssothecium circinans]